MEAQGRVSETNWTFGALYGYRLRNTAWVGAVIDILVAISETRYLPSPYDTTYAGGLEGIELES